MRQVVAKWLIICVIGILTLAYGGVAGVKLLRYVRFSEPREAKVEGWKVVQVGNDFYQIEVAGEGFCGRLPKLYRNDQAAETDASALESVTLWYRDGEHCSLDHSFPAKACLYAFIVMGISGFVLSRGRFQKNPKFDRSFF